MYELFGNFMNRYHRGERSAGTDEAELHRMERELVTLLPQDYAAFMRAFGAAHTPGILSILVDTDEPGHLFDLQNITTVDQSIEGTKAYWEAGMPDNIVGFGNLHSINSEI